jgi:hypothetical protein
MSDELVAKFESIVIENLTLAKSRTGHNFTDLHELFGKLGVIETARLLMSPGIGAGFTCGFRILASAGLLHLSIEQTVIDFTDSRLFTEEQVSKARATLTMARMLAASRYRQSVGGLG